MAKRTPELTRENILNAATVEFADKGLDGARIDGIAERAGANKRMIYHYFGNKDDLYLAVLERAYDDIRRHELQLNLQHLDPVAAVIELTRFTFRYYVDHPEFLHLLNNENLHGAANIRRSRTIQPLHNPMVEYIRAVIARGEAAGVFRQGVDPVQLYISIAALGYFYLSNSATLGTIFRRDLLTPDALEDRLGHIVEVILGYLRPETHPAKLPAGHA